MSFEHILKRSVGKITIIRSLEHNPIEGELSVIKGRFYVGKYAKEIPMDEINCMREGKEIDMDLERGSSYFKGGLLN